MKVSDIYLFLLFIPDPSVFSASVSDLYCIAYLTPLPPATSAYYPGLIVFSLFLSSVSASSLFYLVGGLCGLTTFPHTVGDACLGELWSWTQQLDWTLLCGKRRCPIGALQNNPKKLTISLLKVTRGLNLLRWDVCSWPCSLTLHFGWGTRPWALRSEQKCFGYRFAQPAAAATYHQCSSNSNGSIIRMRSCAWKRSSLLGQGHYSCIRMIIAGRCRIVGKDGFIKGSTGLLEEKIVLTVITCCALGFKCSYLSPPKP